MSYKTIIKTGSLEKEHKSEDITLDKVVKSMNKMCNPKGVTKLTMLKNKEIVKNANGNSKVVKVTTTDGKKRIKGLQFNIK